MDSPVSNSSSFETVGEDEILLAPSTKRLVVFPIHHHDLWDMYKKSVASFWTVEEIDTTNDMKCWETKLNDNERYFVKNILAFFAASDGIVNENLATRFYNEVQIPEARQFYAIQIAMEAIHAETYSMLIDTYVRTTAEKNHLLNAVETIPAVKRKADWALKWIDSNDSFGERLVAFAVVEGIFFSGSFCAVFWLKKRGLMPGLCHSNELISRDEGMHCENACMLFRMLNTRPSQDRIHEIFREAVAIELEFINDSLPVGLIGMNATEMSKYIKYIADFWLRKLDCSPLYNVENPFQWMSMISLERKTNFFENRVSEYQKANVSTSPIMNKGSCLLPSTPLGNYVFTTKADF